MPIVKVTLWKGRSGEQKKELAKAITDSMVETINVKPESVQVIFIEVDRENWAVGGNIKE